MTGVFGVSVIMGTIGGGLSAAKQQGQIKNQVCQISDQMNQYKLNALAQLSATQEEQTLYQQKLDNLGSQMATIQNNIKFNHDNYKKTYTYYTIGFIVILMLLIFIFAAKKFILKATTEYPN